MKSDDAPAPEKADVNLTRGVLRRVAQILVVLLFYGVLLFVSAGRLDWLAAWIYLVVYVINVLINMAFLLPKNLEFIAERGKTKQDTKALT